MIVNPGRDSDDRRPSAVPPLPAGRASARFQGALRGFQRLWKRNPPPASATPPDLTGRLELAEGLSVSVHDNGLVALDPRSGLVFTATRIGARIWKHLEERASLEGIASEISRAYRIDRATALGDTCRFLADLQRLGLLRTGAAR